MTPVAAAPTPDLPYLRSRLALALDTLSALIDSADMSIVPQGGIAALLAILAEAMAKV